MHVLVRFCRQCCVLQIVVILWLAAWNANLWGETGASTEQEFGATRSASAAVPRNVDDLRQMQELVQKITERARSSTVGLRIGTTHGSGVIVSKDGYVLTAAHVLGAPDRDVTIHFSNGRTAAGKTLGANYGMDCALIRITDKGDWPFISMRRPPLLKPGQWCVALGHPGGFELGRSPVVRLGRLVSIGSNIVVSDCTLTGGDSGGPLFDLKGNLIGVHSRIGEPLMANMHIPLNNFRKCWDHLVDGRAWGFAPGEGPYLGIIRHQDLEHVLVASVIAGSPAAKAGILPGDEILEFDGQAVKDFSTLSKLVKSKRPGQSVDLRIRRIDHELTLPLVIGTRKG